MRCVVLAKADYTTRVYGLPVVVETRRGRVRRGKEPDGTPWATTMEVPYGYFQGTLGFDGEPVDLFLGDHREALEVYVLMAMKYPEYTVIDEAKVFAGFLSMRDAKICFLHHYPNPRALGPAYALTVEQFKRHLAETSYHPRAS